MVGRNVVKHWPVFVHEKPIQSCTVILPSLRFFQNHKHQTQAPHFVAIMLTTMFRDSPYNSWSSIYLYWFCENLRWWTNVFEINKVWFQVKQDYWHWQIILHDKIYIRFIIKLSIDVEIDCLCRRYIPSQRHNYTRNAGCCYMQS